MAGRNWIRPGHIANTVNFFSLDPDLKQTNWDSGVGSENRWNLFLLMKLETDLRLVDGDQ